MGKNDIPKPKFDFDNAGDINLKIKNLEEGVKRAQENHDIFSSKATEQITLKKTLQEELVRLKLKAEEEGVKINDPN